MNHGDELTRLARLFDLANVAYAVIGAHAVNAWIEPRATADLDVTVFATAAQQKQLRSVFEEAGYRIVREDGATLPSGPDFIRFSAPGRSLTVELQAAKTDLQREVVARAKGSPSRLRVATPEDLIVLKLIAYRPKDRFDLLGLMKLGGMDWSYIERWCEEWQVTDRLSEARSAAAE